MKILIVDDESIVRRSLRRAAEARGHQVEEAAEGFQALEVLQQYQPDLMFLDVLMPGLTGPQLLKKIQPVSFKVILISAYTGEYNMQKAKELGANLFISKPFADIFKVIEQAEEING